jgi:hypothetical protein
MRPQADGGGGGTWVCLCFHSDASSVGALSGVAMDTAGCEVAVAQARGRE